MVKTRTVTQLIPESTPLRAKSTAEKYKRPSFATKSLELALHDVTSEPQCCGCKKQAQQTNQERTQMQKAIKEELQCVADLKLYAVYLVVESGALLDHPWIKKLMDVSNRKLDPHKLLKMYREDPGSLKIADVKMPNHYWMPPEGSGPLQAMSRCAAMRALVGNQRWKESLALQAIQKQHKQVVQPPRDLRNEDDLEDFLGCIAEIEGS